MCAIHACTLKHMGVVQNTLFEIKGKRTKMFLLIAHRTTERERGKRLLLAQLMI